MATLLQVRNLCVQFQAKEGVVRAVDHVNLELHRHQTLGIVGESGSGKSQTVLAMLGLLAANGQATGEVLFEGRNLLSLSAVALNTIRGKRIAMIFQDPMSALNPYLTVGRQMTEVLELHQGLSGQPARQAALHWLDAVQLPDVSRTLQRYPHEFSGGMRQRIMIAMALLCEPDILIADEPTTALDVTVQAQILSLLKGLQNRLGTAIMLITHDLGVVAGLCDQILVMYGGQVMEQGPAQAIFQQPSHPYTLGLMGAIPRLDRPQQTLINIPGNPPNMSDLPAGCPFTPRCRFVLPRCASVRPAWLPHQDTDGVFRACHRPEGEVR